MTTGQCIIDGVDIATLGAFIERGGSNDLLMFPERRKPDQNDWFESDGLEIDVSDVSFDAKKVTINYVILADNYNEFKDRLNGFQMLHNKTEVDIYVREYDTTFALRYVQSSGYRHKGGYYNYKRKIGKVYIDYIMDDPMQLYTDAIGSPVDGVATFSNVLIDNRDLSAYGIMVNDVYTSAFKPRSAKNVLVNKIHSIDGQVVDEVAASKGSKEIVIDCVMTASSVASLKINLNALFNVMRKNVAPVSLRLAHESIDCYYMKMSQFRKLTPFSRKIRVAFKLHLQEVSWMQLFRFLATQNGMRINTQNGKYIIAI